MDNLLTIQEQVPVPAFRMKELKPLDPVSDETLRERQMVRNLEDENVFRIMDKLAKGTKDMSDEIKDEYDKKSKEAQYEFEFRGLVYKLMEKVDKLVVSGKPELMHDIFQIENFVYALIAEADLDGEGSWYGAGNMTDEDLDKLEKQMGETFAEEVKDSEAIISQVEREQAFASELVRRSKNGKEKKHTLLVRSDVIVDGMLNSAINTDAKVVGMFDDNGKFKKVDNPS